RLPAIVVCSSVVPLQPFKTNDLANEADRSNFRVGRARRPAAASATQAFPSRPKCWLRPKGEQAEGGKAPTAPSQPSHHTCISAYVSIGSGSARAGAPLFRG